MSGIVFLCNTTSFVYDEADSAWVFSLTRCRVLSGVRTLGAVGCVVLAGGHGNKHRNRQVLQNARRIFFTTGLKILTYIRLK